MVLPVRTVKYCTAVLAAIFFFGGGRALAGLQGKPATHLITIENMVYTPAELAVHPGDWLVFSNKDLFPHTVTADGKSFDSKGIPANGTWKYRAGAAGVYSYHCAFHPTMKGKITVR